MLDPTIFEEVPKLILARSARFGLAEMCCCIEVTLLLVTEFGFKSAKRFRLGLSEDELVFDKCNVASWLKLSFSLLEIGVISYLGEQDSKESLQGMRHQPTCGITKMTKRNS